MKAGIIGAGLQGRRRAEAVRQSDKAGLVIVADTDVGRARRLADEMGCRATTDWEEVVAEKAIEVVIICTPPHLHMTMCIKALKSGKHVLCEKPLALTVEEAEEILRVAQETELKIKCGFNLRHHPGVLQARKWVDQGSIGEVMFIRGCYGTGGRPGYEKEWRANPAISGGGQLIDQGMHLIDLSRWFLGDFFTAFGFFQTGFWDISPVEDNAFILLRTDGGQIASLHASWTQWKNLFIFEIFGKEGYIVVEGLGKSYGVERATLGKRAFLEPFREETIEFRGDDQSWIAEWQEFVRALEEKREPLGNGYDGWQALKVAGAVYESAATGRSVNLK